MTYDAATATKVKFFLKNLPPILRGLRGVNKRNKKNFLILGKLLSGSMPNFLYQKQKEKKMSKLNQITNVERKYNKQGQLTLETTYDDGKKHGFEKKYRNGFLYMTTPYRLGIKFGVEQEYVSKGILCQEVRYINGEKESIKIYDTDGVVLSEETFSLGDREVEIKISGRYKYETFYINGEEVSYNKYDSDDRIVYSTYNLPNRGLALTIAYDKKNYQISSQIISGEGDAPDIGFEYWGIDSFTECSRGYGQKNNRRLIRNYSSGYIVREVGFIGGKMQGLEKIYGRGSVLLSETMYRRHSSAFSKKYTDGVLSHVSVDDAATKADKVELQKLSDEKPHLFI